MIRRAIKIARSFLKPPKGNRPVPHRHAIGDRICDKLPERWVAIVTGGATGIGKATVEALCRRGASVAIVGRDEQKGTQVADALKTRGFDCAFMPCDITRKLSCDRLVEEVETRWGHIDALVANAAIRSSESVETATNEDWLQLLQTNLIGTSNICASALPTLRQSDHGSIVIVSSINAVVGRKGMDLYDASKAAVLSLMRTLAASNASSGTRVNAVCPGYTLTDYHLAPALSSGSNMDQIRLAASDYCPLGRAAEPEEIASAISFLAGPESSFITGQALNVDGGLSTLQFK